MEQQQQQPSLTALGAALYRAAHQVFDEPLVFQDPLALTMVGDEAASALRSGVDPLAGRGASALRAFVVTRSRLAEDLLSSVAADGIQQYVLLGAGLDTFAYRALARYEQLRVIEVDHPATQAWKRARLKEAGVAEPERLTFVALDFERETLAEGLARIGFDRSVPSMFGWLGVVPYLTRDALLQTLRFIGSLGRGTRVVFDYAGEGRTEAQRADLAALAERVSGVGEPFRTYLSPEQLAVDAKALGYSLCEDFDSEVLSARYFADRSDGLSVRGAGHIAVLTV